MSTPRKETTLEKKQIYFLALFMNDCDAVLVSGISTGTTSTAQVLNRLWLK